jgi:hypothetical protein
MDFQWPFVASVADYLFRVAPWGDGKTLCSIIKGMFLSQLYPGNEGLIIRKRYNALERSTMQDFERWTGMKVPTQKHTVIFPDGKTKIHFAHAENLLEFKEGLQGMNLGWAYIEQGDDFNSSEVFDMLIGRVRRVLTPRKDVQKKLVTLGVIPKVVKRFEEFLDPLPAKEAAALQDRIETAIKRQLKLPVRQIIVIANACGHNWIWKRVNPDCRTSSGLKDGYEYSNGKPFENIKYVPKQTRQSWSKMKKTSPKKYNRYVMNSHEDYDIEGSYYAELMSDALKQGRVECVNLYDSTEVVYTFWDLGVHDETVIWFVQFIRNEIHLIDYYSNTGKGMVHYSEVLTGKRYEYMAHYLPHDVKQRLQGEEITTRLDILRKLRVKKHEDVHVVERHAIAERIQAVRDVLPHCYFDNNSSDGVDCMNNYCREINKAKSTEEDLVFSAHPAHDQWSHGADGFGYMAIVHQNMSINGLCLGATGPEPDRWDEAFVDDGGDTGVKDLLEVGG